MRPRSFRSATTFSCIKILKKKKSLLYIILGTAELLFSVHLLKCFTQYLRFNQKTNLTRGFFGSTVQKIIAEVDRLKPPKVRMY